MPNRLRKLLAPSRRLAAAQWARAALVKWHLMAKKGGQDALQHQRYTFSRLRLSRNSTRIPEKTEFPRNKQLEIVPVHVAGEMRKRRQAFADAAVEKLLETGLK